MSFWSTVVTAGKQELATCATCRHTETKVGNRTWAVETHLEDPGMVFLSSQHRAEDGTYYGFERVAMPLATFRELVLAMGPVSAALEAQQRQLDEEQTEVACMEARATAGRQVDFCLVCKQEIDISVCHCGESREGHDAMRAGHTFTPMGCICGRTR